MVVTVLQATVAKAFPDSAAAPETAHSLVVRVALVDEAEAAELVQVA